MKKIILIAISIFALNSCKNLKNADNEQIKKTTIAYFKAIERNDTLMYKKIYKINDGGDMYEFNFMQRNYQKINPNNILLKNMKVKDTFSAGVNQKYVEFILKKPNYKPFEKNEDLRLYLMFWEKTGLAKIEQVFIIGNTAKWENQKPLINF